MKKGRWLVALALVWLAGCCAHPGVFQQVHRTLETVQGFYEPLLGSYVNDQWRVAVVAADTTLMLAGALQEQWCPDPGQAEQLTLQARQAEKLAQDAGVAVPPAPSPEAGAPERQGR